MEIYVNGQRITLTQNQFVAKGGEGSIYKRDAVAYKIYEDLAKMVPLGKLQELAILEHPNIIRPKDLIYNNKKDCVGFTTDWAADCVVLCRLFTNNFRDANNISSDSTLELIENIKKTTHFIHQKNCLIVDGNELNYLIAPDFKTPYFIDVNSWQTPNYPATAIMPTIRDWSSKDFSVLTDWFSFAVISFQLFTGIHPFKGRYKNPKENDLPTRVSKNISVFNKDVAVPTNIRDFNLIPSKYKDWFFSLFEKGKRELPPELPGAIAVAQVVIKLIKSTEKLNITELREFDSKILYHNSEFDVTKTERKLWIKRTDYIVNRTVEILFTPLEGYPILVKREDKEIKFMGLSIPVDPIDINCEDTMIINNTLYIKSEGKLIEMEFKVFDGKILPSIKKVWDVAPLSSVLFSGVIFQSLLGKPYIIIPIPSFKNSQYIIKDVPELEGAQVIDMKYDNKICMIVYNKDGAYNKMILVFNDDFSKYTTRIMTNITYGPINFVTLENGVCVHIIEDEKLEVFFNKYGSTDVKLVEDKDISIEMHLTKYGKEVRFFSGNKLYSVTLKK